MRAIQLVYIFILVYIIAALLFWGHTLNVQSKTIYEYQKKELALRVDSVEQPMQFKISDNTLKEKLSKRNRQYTSEGVTFLLIIIMGAGIVYTALRRTQLLSKQQQNFMLSITHELKSPIAAVKLNLETIGKRKLTEEQLQTLVGRSIKESNRLNDLCNNLLLASQLQSAQFKPASERINLTDIVEDTLQQFAYRDAHIIASEVEEDVFIAGDKLLWRLVISNLLENAIKYTPPKSTIEVKLSKTEEEEALLQVVDNGAGIKDEEKKKIFQKFYRIGNEESRNTKGTGLGLYIVSEIVNRHKGSIEIRDNEPQGSVFEITIPTA